MPVARLESKVLLMPLTVVAPPVEVLEGGLRYEVDVRQGQKTGFYVDQRENRARVRAMAAGRRVLDAYCFTGGFSLDGSVAAFALSSARSAAAVRSLMRRFSALRCLR